MDDLSEIAPKVESLRKLGLTREIVQTFSVGAQNLTDAYLLVSCGDVCQMEVVNNSPLLTTVTAYVHSEKTAALFYKASVSISTDGTPALQSYTCTCKGMVISSPLI